MKRVNWLRVQSDFSDVETVWQVRGIGIAFDFMPSSIFEGREEEVGG